MKQALTFLLSLFQILDFACAQSGDNLPPKTLKEVAIEVNAIKSPLLSRNFYGINFNIKYFPEKRFGTGAYILFSQKKISDTFTYSIKKPIIQLYEIGWINQYNFLQSNKVRMGISLVNIFSQVRLGDNAIKEKRHKNAPKEISSNFFYTLEPGSNFSYKFISGKGNADFWVTAEANYNFVFGNAKYGMRKDFSSPLFGIGITIAGLVDDKEQAKK